jgi:hypothetical protein
VRDFIWENLNTVNKNLRNDNKIEMDIKTLRKFENETLLTLNELDDELHRLNYSRFINNEDDFDYQKAIQHDNLDKSNIADVFKFEGGETNEDGELKIGNSTDFDRQKELEKLKNMFESIDSEELLAERLKSLEDISILGNTIGLSDHEKLNKVNELLEEYYRAELEENGDEDENQNGQDENQGENSNNNDNQEGDYENDEGDDDNGNENKPLSNQSEKEVNIGVNNNKKEDL